MKYQINFTDRNGVTSAIDTVEGPAFTAEEYIEGCRENADQEWIDMLESGTVTVERIEVDLWTGYSPDGKRVRFVCDEDGYVLVCVLGGETTRWNDERYDDDSFGDLKLAVMNEGYRLD